MTILMLETIGDEAMAVLKSAAPVFVSPTPDAHSHDLPLDDVTAIVTRGLGQLDRALINKCPNLKVIARCGAGLNNLDLEAAAEKNIQVIFAPGISAPAVAEHSLMLMLMAIRQGFVMANQVKQNNWESRNSYGGDDLRDKSICIVGGGNTGRQLAKLCWAFDATVVIAGRSGKGHEGLKANLVKLLPDSDVVSLHIPLTDETRNLFDADMLSMMKPGAILINTARGDLVHTAALIDALDSGQVSAYASDVVAGGKPVKDDLVVNHPRSIVTPHMAALTKRTYREMGLFMAHNVVSVLTGVAPNPVSLYQGAA